MKQGDEKIIIVFSPILPVRDAKMKATVNTIVQGLSIMTRKALDRPSVAMTCSRICRKRTRRFAASSKMTAALKL